MLMIHLKRFGFDWEAGRAIKSDDYFEVNSVTKFRYLAIFSNNMTIVFIVSLGIRH